MSSKNIEVIESEKSVIPIDPKPFCLGVKYGDTVYVSGNIGLDPKTSKLVEGDVADRTVGETS
jgi:2-iminobutanoate/2-iminopropanoate deaminase